MASLLLHGPLATPALPWPLTLRVLLCDLRPRFLRKGEAGRGHRAVARNGRVLLASDRPLAELIGRAAELRLQSWHRASLAGHHPEPWGLLVCIRCLEETREVNYTARLSRSADGLVDLAIDVGGRMSLQFERAT